MLVQIGASQVLDAILVVDRAQPRDRQFHTHLLLELFAPLLQGEPTQTLEGGMRFEERCNISLDFERRFRAAVVTTIMNIVGALSYEALDSEVARRDWNAHDFRELRLGHEVSRKVGQ